MQPAAKTYAPDTTAKPRVYLERIGGTSWELPEAELNVFDEVRLWHENPRLLPHLPSGGFESEEALMAALRLTPGYDTLRKSIEDLGQMEPVYAWRKDENADKYIVFEGSTRVAILRELSLKHSAGKKAGSFDRVKVKILPSHFGEKERAILLARIHVRGTGVRAWGRYIEAKFIYDHVVDGGLMSVTDMANHMEKSVSWVQRLRDAYQFAMKFVEYIDNDDAVKMAANQFSTLEEISKAPKIGPWLREYDDASHDTLRSEVFDMVRNEVFKEYRDARFMKQFHEDPEKWEALKSGEKHIASRLAAELKHSATSLKVKISSLESSIERAIQRGDEHELNDDDVQHLRNCISRIQEKIHVGVDRFRLDLKAASTLLSETSLANIKSLQPGDLDEFEQALEYFNMLRDKFKGKT